MKETYDVVIAGGGPAGASCGTVCAQGGLRTLILEKSRFPRDKVCGDCINPACWPVLDRLGVSKAILGASHTKLNGVRFIAVDGRATFVPFRTPRRGEIAIRRLIFDAILLDRAREAGAEVLENTPVKAVSRGPLPWRIETDLGQFRAKYLIAADGRNSTVARMLGLMPLASKNRIGLQTHAARTGESDSAVSLRLLPFGYCGISSIDNQMLNVCLVSRPRDIASLKEWAQNEFDIADPHNWRTIAPLSRRSINPVLGHLLFTGDAARVVEPFTGEGIYYAIASGELAARSIIGGKPDSVRSRPFGPLPGAALGKSTGALGRNTPSRRQLATDFPSQFAACPEPVDKKNCSTGGESLMDIPLRSCTTSFLRRLFDSPMLRDSSYHVRFLTRGRKWRY